MFLSLVLQKLTSISFVDGTHGQYHLIKGGKGRYQCHRAKPRARRRSYQDNGKPRDTFRATVMSVITALHSAACEDLYPEQTLIGPGLHCSAKQELYGLKLNRTQAISSARDNVVGTICTVASQVASWRATSESHSVALDPGGSIAIRQAFKKDSAFGTPC